jgi:hypothetical protein
VACLAAAVESSVGGVAAEELWLSFLQLFAAEGRPINAASILPDLLRSFGDVADVLSEIAPRPVLVAAGVGDGPNSPRSVRVTDQRFTKDARVLAEWLRE